MMVNITPWAPPIHNHVQLILLIGTIKFGVIYYVTENLIDYSCNYLFYQMYTRNTLKIDKSSTNKDTITFFFRHVPLHN